MANRCTHIPEIMLPRAGTDLSKWAVIACDQYTSQPEYWAETDRTVGDAPSTLRLTLPEVYLEQDDVAERTEKIHHTMRRYIEDGTLRTLPAGVILTERWSGGSCPRRGIVLAVDLEAYEYTPGSASLIRPTEKTVVERIPPRLKVRQGACMELPHIMILIDDPERKIIEPLFDQTEQLEKVYDTDLMQNGGHITGWFLPKGAQTDTIEAGLEALCDRETFNRKYGCTDAQALLPYAVGDGNHSMATAKAYWEEVKAALSAEEQATHPARFVLVEVVNIHDESLSIEPIHRILFGVDTDELLSGLTASTKHKAAKLISQTKLPPIPLPIFSRSAPQTRPVCLWWKTPSGPSRSPPCRPRSTLIWKTTHPRASTIFMERMWSAIWPKSPAIWALSCRISPKTICSAALFLTAYCRARPSPWARRTKSATIWKRKPLSSNILFGIGRSHTGCVLFCPVKYCLVPLYPT